MFAAKLLAPVLVLAISLVQVALQAKWRRSHDARTEFHKRVRAGLVGLMVVLTFVTCLIVWQDHRDSVHLAAKVDELLADNQNLKREVGRSTEQIMALGEANANLTSEVAKSVTGGDSFCYYVFMCNRVGWPRYQMTRLLMHQGLYPLYDVHIRICDVNELKDKNWGANLSYQGQLNLGTTRIEKPTFFKLGQGSVGVDEEFVTLPKEREYQQYSIFFTARNGEWHQMVSMRWIKGSWQVASRVACWREEGRKEVLFMPDDVSPGYPRDAKGEVLW